MEAAIYALLSTACDEHGWLSDMQYDNVIEPDFDMRWIDVGVGTIDVQHAVEVVLEAANWTPQTVTAEQVASIKAEALEDAARGFDQPDGDTHITYEFVRDRLNGQAARLRESEVKS